MKRLLLLLGICFSWAVCALAQTNVFSTNLYNVTLAWDPSPETNVAKYVLYQGMASGQYTRQIDVTNKVNGVLATTNVVPNLNAATTYYFVVTARSTTGLESPPSNEIAYTTPPAIVSPALLSSFRVLSVSTNMPPTNTVTIVLQLN